MRLKTFHAKSLKDAMLLVREQLGEDAIIVDTHDAEGPQGARVTAAIEREDDPFEDLTAASVGVIETITDALERHGAPPALTDRLVDEASMIEETDATKALAYALEEVFRFDPLPDGSADRPLILVGPPGVGKTVGCVKLAARAALNDLKSDPDDADLPAEKSENRLPVNLIGADKVKIGAMEQLALYADRLGAHMAVVSDGKALAQTLQKLPKGDLVVVDTPGTNPFNLEEMAHIVDLAEAADMEPVLVLTAGRDAEEAADLAKAFRPVGATRLLITGYDIARRLGSMLAAAQASGLSLSDIGRSPRIADGFQPLDPATLAQMLLPNSSKVQGA